MITATIDQASIARFNAAIMKKAELVGKGSGEILKEQTQLLMKDIVKYTPPIGKTEGLARKQGEAKVEAEIKRAVHKVDPLLFKNVKTQNRIKSIVASGNVADMQAICDNMPGLKDKKVVPFSPSLHESQRVRGNKLKVKEQNKLTLDIKAWDKYAKQVKSHVGRLKASWLPALEALGMTGQNWVNRHSAWAKGVCRIHSKFTGPNPYIAIHNKAHTIGTLKHAVESALKIRYNTMIRQLKYLMKNNIRPRGL